jgi:phosphoglycerate dehydrogenase-like enzyme
MRKKAAFFCNDGTWDSGSLPRVYGDGRREQIDALTACCPAVITARNFEEHAPELRDLEVIFSTWGMPAPSAQQLDQLPQLRAVFYAAGSVQGFARLFLERNILVCSAWAANAIPVAEFTLRRSCSQTRVTSAMCGSIAALRLMSQPFAGGATSA